jgi:hypothetical protein
MSNFDFGNFIDDDNKFEEMPLTDAEENCLSPYGILSAMLGRLKARRVYNRLVKIAQRISDAKGGRPAILLDEDGGEFVTIHEEHV